MASQAIEEKTLNEWLPVYCKALQTVGLHDTKEAGVEAVENYEPSQFFASEFILTENRTFTELLSDSTSKWFVTMQFSDSVEKFEFTCTPVRGRSEETGYVCTNTPAQDILMINPGNNRFTRAAVGAWTFFHPSDLETGASLLVEHGSCNPLETSTSP